MSATATTQVITKEQAHSMPVLELIKLLQSFGHTQGKIAQIMNSYGLRTKQGKIWSRSYISYHLNVYAKMNPVRGAVLKTGKGTKSTPAPTKTVSFDVLDNILRHPHLTDTQMVKMIGGYIYS